MRLLQLPHDKEFLPAQQSWNTACMYGWGRPTQWNAIYFSSSQGMLVPTSTKPNLVLISKLNSYLNYRVYYLKKQQLTSFLGFNPIFFWNLFSINCKLKSSPRIFFDCNDWQKLKKGKSPFLTNLCHLINSDRKMNENLLLYVLVHKPSLETYWEWLGMDFLRKQK